MPRLTLWPLPLAFLLLGTFYLLARQHERPFSDYLDHPGSYPPPPPHHAPPSHHAPTLDTPSRAGSRLNLTLAGNELRYQAAVRARRALIEKIGGPDSVAYVISLQFPIFFSTALCCNLF